MIWWLASIAYVAVGIWCIPRFARAKYPGIHNRWNLIQTKQQSMREAVGFAFAESLIWPVFLVINMSVGILTAEEKAVEDEKNRAKSVEEARTIITRYEAEERSKWTRQFGGRQ